MIKKFLLLILSLYLFKSNADTPGQVAIADSKVTIKNITRLNDYIFYWQVEHDSAKAFNRDSFFIIPGSGGRPMDAMCWAINKKTNISTDTIFLSNYYAPDFIIKVDTIYSENKILYSKEEVSNSNSGHYDGGGNSGESETGHSSKFTLYSVISLIALILLVWFFIRRKNMAKKI